MQRSLREHITFLEEKIASLKTQQGDRDRTPGERNQSAVDLGIAERALVHFQKAYELEQKLSGAVMRSNERETC